MSRSLIGARVGYLQLADVVFQNRLDRSPFVRNSPKLTRNTAAMRTGSMRFDGLVIDWNRKIIQASSMFLADSAVASRGRSNSFNAGRAGHAVPRDMACRARPTDLRTDSVDRSAVIVALSLKPADRIVEVRNKIAVPRFIPIATISTGFLVRNASANSNRIRSAWRAWSSLGLLVVAISASSRVLAQDSGSDPLPQLPEGPKSLEVDAPIILPEVPTLPGQGRAHVDSFVEGLSRGDAKFSVRLGHGKILNLKKDLFAGADGQPSIAVGDPTIADFTPISSRRVRVLGLRLGTTDLSIETADGQTITFDVIVGPELDLVRGQLLQEFPDLELTLGQVGDHVVVEGQARSLAQISQILRSISNSIAAQSGGGQPTTVEEKNVVTTATPVGVQSIDKGVVTQQQKISSVKILNLLRVPTSQQVLLKVRIAELNRTAFRQIGANVLASTSKNGALFGTQLSNTVTGIATTDVFQPQQGSRLTPSKFFIGEAASALNSSNSLFGIFQNSNFEILLSALRKNSILKILAEPDLVAYNGHRASFLAGGEFPIPVPQIGATGVASTITVNFKKFGVQLDFLPVVLDGDSIRLTVDPEVSSIDTTLGTTLVAGGSPVPGLNTRNAHTTVELRQGQTLAIAGLMQLSLEGQTTRIPGLGDLPVIGPFFSNTTSNRVEKELVVLVTPYLVEPLEHGQVPPMPGDEVGAPNDLEFYLLNRLEGRTGRDFRATTDGADPLRIGKLIHLERKNIRGPYGFSE
jgi:pilus assembly protein CpaC